MSAQATTGQRTVLRTYTTSQGARVICGQRVNGHVRVMDRPAEDRPGRSYLIAPRVESRAELDALIEDYLGQAERFDAIPIHVCW